MLVAVRLELGCIDHLRIRFTALICQLQQHPGKNTFLTLPLPKAVKRLRGPAFSGRISPPQAVAVNENKSTKNVLVTHTRVAVRFRKERLQLCYLLIAQPIKISHITAPF